jgi:hypothetical protein
LAGPTRSSKALGRLALVLGLAATVAIPAAIAFAQESPRLTLVQAGWAVPAAAVLGIAALLVARTARRRAQWSVLAQGGGKAARAGRFLGVLALCLAASGAIAVGFYELLLRY